MVQGRRRRTKSEIATILEEYEASGLSQREFSKRRRISLSTLSHWWRSRSQASDSGTVRRVEIIDREVPPGDGDDRDGEGFEIHWPTGVWLRVPSGSQGAEIREVLEAVESQCWR